MIPFYPRLKGRVVRVVFCALLATTTTAFADEAKDTEQAIKDRWQEYCSSGYCEGYHGRIIEIADEYIAVSINGNRRYLRYSVNKTSSGYYVSMVQGPNNGRKKP